MIGERKKNEHLESKMYSGDFVETATIEGGGGKSKQKKEQGQSISICYERSCWGVRREISGVV